MYRSHVTPRFIEVLDHQSPMTPLSGELTAQQGGPGREKTGIQAFLDPPVRHEPQELIFILAPGPKLFLVGVEKRLGRREQRFMAIDGLTELCHEEIEIVALRESGKL